MATIPVSSVEVARSLAQSCWTRCRDSSSSFKLLTGSVRKLRNTLEEVEEIYDETTRTLGPDDLKLLESVSKARKTLEQLDSVLKTNQESGFIDVDGSDVADIKTSLDVTDHELSLAYEAVTTGEIPLQLDTSVRPRSASHGVSTSSYTPESALEGQSSRTSSSWSMVQKESGRSPSSADSALEEYGGEHRWDRERQLNNLPKQDVQLVTPTSGASEERRPSLDWRSPFASPDPMSISIEQASSLILSTDDELASAITVRSRSGTGSTVVVDPPAIQLPPPENSSADTSGNNSKEPQESGSTPIHSHEPLILSESVSKSNTSTATEPFNHGERINTHIRRASEVGHLSPLSATREAAGRHRSYSTNSTTGRIAPQVPVDSKPRNSEDRIVRRVSYSYPPIQGRHSPSRVAPVIEQGQVFGKWDNGLGIDIGSPASSLSPAGDIALPSTPTSQIPTSPASAPVSPQKVPHSPTMPTRRPPPPPVPRRAKTNVRASSYRIVNASPMEEPSSDEEDLYSNSKPSSPMRLSNSPITAREIPRVNVADHDMEMTRAAETLGERSHVTLTPAVDDDLLKTTPTGTVSPGDNEGGAAQSNEPSQVTQSSEEPSTDMTKPKTQPAGSQEPRTEALRAEDVPPPIPPRPARYRRRSSAKQQRDKPLPPVISSVPIAINRETTGAINEKELTLESGLEVRKAEDEGGLQVLQRPEAAGGLEVNTGWSRQDSALKERVGVDTALFSSQPIAVANDNSMSRTTPPAVVLEPTSNTSTIPPEVAEWYGPGSATSFPELEKERINHILHFWNSQAWDQAEAYLTDYLTAVIEEDAHGVARRIQHLLGVCASFQGEFSRAVPFFLSAMRTPILDISDLDDGDCAAAYWLGDIYALTNQRTEALLAYCIAERSSLFQFDQESSLSTLIGLEQEAVQLGKPKADFKVQYAQIAFRSSPSAEPDSILDSKVVTSNAAKMLFDNQPRIDRKKYNSLSRDGPFELNLDRHRSNSLFLLEYPRKVFKPSHFHNVKLTPTHFLPNTTWPLMYDPFFAISNVQRGRLLMYECDLVDVFSTNEGAKVSRGGPASLGRVDSFTSDDLIGLVETVRDCLRTYEMEWSEVANVATTAFLVRYSFMLDKIATTYYFTIRLFKQTLRTGYGVEICPDGIVSSRHIKRQIGYEKGVSQEETKRVKKLIREHLEVADKQRGKPGRKSAFPRMGRSQDEERPPPIPPRPRSAIDTRQTLI